MIHKICQTVIKIIIVVINKCMSTAYKLQMTVKSPYVSGKHYCTLLTLFNLMCLIAYKATYTPWAIKTCLLILDYRIGGFDTYCTNSASLQPPRDWRRPRGHPHTTRLRGIDANVQSENIGIHSAWRKANNRVLWRRIIDMATLQ